MCAADSNTETPSTPTPIEEPSSKTATTAPAAVKPGRRDLGLDQACVRIVVFIKRHGGRVTMSQLRRGLNAYRHPQVYEAAIKHLLDLGAIKVEKPGSRRQWISVIRIPKRYQAIRPNPKRRRHRPRSRGRNPWFELLLAKKTLKKELELWANDVRRAREEDKRRSRHRFLADVLAMG